MIDICPHCGDMPHRRQPCSGACNSHRLQESIAQLDAGKGTERQLLDPISTADTVMLPIGGYWILLDAEDVWRVMEHNWYPSTQPGYLQSTIDGKMVPFHRFVPGALPGVYVDHQNGLTWDNRKSNLRSATASQNARNTRPHRGSSSPYKGVHVVSRKSGPRYRAIIQIDGKPRHLGTFKSETAAARAYDQMAREHFGEFAWVNFP